MATLNEELIRKVFDEMVKVRPKLTKYLIVDDDDDEDDEEEVDYRILGDLIIRNYPWPIGVELRRLFSGSMRQLDRLRLDQIFKTIERTMQFISFVMISQLWKDKASGKIEIPDSFKNDFTNRFAVLSLGNYSWIIRALGKMYQEQGVEWFMPEIGESFDKKFYAALDFWVPERNEIGHYQINLTQEDIEAISLGAELHDIGMVGDLTSLLEKNKLENKEIDLIKKHPLIGGIMVEPISHIYNITDIIKYHHERFDGKGYPFGLEGFNIPLNAHIVALGEFYAGLTSDRAYRKGKTHEEAIEEIKKVSNIFFDESLIKGFLDVSNSIKIKLEKLKIEKNDEK